MDLKIPLLVGANLLNNVVGKVTGKDSSNVDPKDVVEVVNSNGDVLMKVVHPNDNASVAGNRVDNSISKYSSGKKSVID